jgi:hypothetical protein
MKSFCRAMPELGGIFFHRDVFEEDVGLRCGWARNSTFLNSMTARRPIASLQIERAG